MGISIFKKSRGKEEIDIKEAFNIWNMLRSRYHSADTVRLLQNITHDRDFDIILGQLLDEWKKYIELYEDKAKKLQLKVPNRPPYDYKTSVKVDQFTDAYIYRHIYNGIIADMYPLVTGYRTTTTNDSVRQIIQDDLVEHLSSFELMYKYGKLKGWMDEPPAFKTSAPTTTEPITAGEAFHLLDHISHRYHQIQLTEFYLSFTHDKDFRLILSQGAKNLEKQVASLQEIAMKYEINLPNQHPASTQVPIEPEAATDALLYAAIFNGIQSAIDLHVRAVIETIRNDSLRRIFYKLFTEQVEMHERYLKYGKAKGWLMVVPVF
jgi:spore coat protein CotF